MFKFMERLFAANYIKDLQDFTRVLKKGSCKSGSIKPYFQESGTTITGTSGGVMLVSRVTYGLKITATLSDGRQIIHKKHLFEALGLGELADRNTRRIFGIGEQAKKKLRTNLHGVPINLIGMDNRPMNKKICAELYREAMAYGGMDRTWHVAKVWGDIT